MSTSCFLKDIDPIFKMESYQSTMSCFSIVIDPIFNTNMLSRVLLDDIDSIFKISKNFQGVFSGFPGSIFSNMFKHCEFPHFTISQNIFFEIGSGGSCIVCSHLLSPKIKVIGFGSHGRVKKCENHEHDGFSVVPKVKSKSY